MAQRGRPRKGPNDETVHVRLRRADVEEIDAMILRAHPGISRHMLADLRRDEVGRLIESFHREYAVKLERGLLNDRILRIAEVVAPVRRMFNLPDGDLVGYFYGLLPEEREKVLGEIEEAFAIPKP